MLWSCICLQLKATATIESMEEQLSSLPSPLGSVAWLAEQGRQPLPAWAGQVQKVVVTAAERTVVEVGV